MLESTGRELAPRPGERVRVLPSSASGAWTGTVTVWDAAAPAGCLVSLKDDGGRGLEGRQIWVGAHHRWAPFMVWFEAGVVATFMDTEVALAGVTPLSIEPRREAVRANLRGCATLTLHGGMTALADVADISSGGCRLTMPGHLLPIVGQDVTLDIILGSVEVSSRATVTRVEGVAPSTVALRFLDLEASQREVVDRAVLASLSAARR